MVKVQYIYKVAAYRKKFKEGDSLTIEAINWLRDYYSGGSNFGSLLVRLIQKGDGWNRARLKEGFPVMVDLFEMCDRGGGEGWNKGHMDFQRQITEGF